MKTPAIPQSWNEHPYPNRRDRHCHSGSSQIRRKSRPENDRGSLCPDQLFAGRRLLSLTDPSIFSWNALTPERYFVIMPNVIKETPCGGRFCPVTKESAMKRSRKRPALSIQEKAQIFKSLGHPTRLRIVEKLAEGEQCVCVLLEMFDIDISTLSRHLSVLKNAGVVVDDKRGKNVFYSLKCPCMLDIFECMDDSMAGRRCG